MEPLPPIQRKLFSSNGGPTTTAKLSLLFRRDEGKSNEAKKVSAHNTPQSRNKPLALDVSKQNKETKSSSNLPQEKTDQVQHRSRSHTTAIITPPGMSSTAPKLQLRKRRQEEASVTGAQGTQKKQTVAVSDAADKEVVVRAATPNIVSPNPRRCSVSLNSKPHTMSNAESSPFDADQCGDRISILPHSIEYVTAEERELAMIRHEALDLTDEFQSDLVKIEDVIADSFATHRRAAQKVLDANVILSECLLDVITDLCAIVGEVSLLDFGSDDKR